MSVSGTVTAAHGLYLSSSAVPPATLSASGAVAISLTGGVDTFAATLSSNVPIGSVAGSEGHASGNLVSTTVGTAAGVVGMSSI